MKKIFIIRKARLSDLNSILLLLYQLSPVDVVNNIKKSNKQYAAILKRIINDNNYILIIAKYKNNIVGTGMLLVQLNLSHSGRPYGHIENIVVEKNMRGLGIGKNLIKYLVSQSIKIGCYKVILNCVEKNHKFYKKLGFKKTGQVEMRVNHKRT